MMMLAFDDSKVIVIKAALTQEELVDFVKCTLEGGGNIFNNCSPMNVTVEAMLKTLSVSVEFVEKHFAKEVKMCSEFHMEDKLIKQAEDAGINLDKLMERAMHKKMRLD